MFQICLQDICTTHFPLPAMQWFESHFCSGLSDVDWTWCSRCQQRGVEVPQSPLLVSQFVVFKRQLLTYGESLWKLLVVGSVIAMSSVLPNQLYELSAQRTQVWDSPGSLVSHVCATVLPRSCVRGLCTVHCTSLRCTLHRGRQTVCSRQIVPLFRAPLVVSALVRRIVLTTMFSRSSRSSTSSSATGTSTLALVEDLQGPVLQLEVTSRVQHIPVHSPLREPACQFHSAPNGGGATVEWRTRDPLPTPQFQRRHVQRPQITPCTMVPTCWSICWRTRTWRLWAGEFPSLFLNQPFTFDGVSGLRMH